MNKKTKAIEFIEEARQTHVEWAEFLEKLIPEESLQYSIAGDRTHHLEWVAKYDDVLEILLA